MAKQVTTIPASIKPFFKTPLAALRKCRVAAYARVSTDSDEQFTSYEAQVDYYTNYIKGRNDWQFAGVYTDEGITGTNTKKRKGFKRMVKDALDKNRPYRHQIGLAFCRKHRRFPHHHPKAERTRHRVLLRKRKHMDV